MSVRRYLTGDAFRNALEQRLRKNASHGDDFNRRRQLLVFHRFLARASQVFADAITLLMRTLFDGSTAFHGPAR